MLGGGKKGVAKSISVGNTTCATIVQYLYSITGLESIGEEARVVC